MPNRKYKKKTIKTPANKRKTLKKKYRKGGYREDREYPDGSYKGNIEDGIREGKGRMYYSDDSIYVGEWKNDKRDGKGTLFNSDNRVVFKGIWKNDEEYESVQDLQHREYAPKKTITIMINAHGLDLLTQDTSKITQLYPNANVRILSQAGGTCSVAVTVPSRGNRATSIGNNISNNLEQNPDLSTFEILNKYRLHPTRDKYARSVIAHGNERDISRYEADSRIYRNTYKRTVDNSMNLVNFSLFTPVIDHKYIFTDHNNALQNNPGIFVLNIRNFPDSPLIEDMKHISLSESQRKNLYSLFVQWLLRAYKYVGAEYSAPAQRDSSRLLPYFLRDNNINNIEQLVNYFKSTDINWFIDNRPNINVNDFIKKMFPEDGDARNSSLQMDFDKIILYKLNIAQSKYFGGSSDSLLPEILLTELVDKLYRDGFEIINIVDLSCRYYLFDNWQSADETTTPMHPTEEQEDEFIDLVNQREAEAAFRIDSRYGGKTRKYRVR